MSSPDSTAEREDARQAEAGVGALLDTTFGYFIWAAHLLIIYIATAVSCQLGLGTAGSTARSTLLVALVLATVAAAGLVVAHAARRYRRRRDQPDQTFRVKILIGNSAVATVAICLQLLAITMVPICT